ncbi:MAG: hypothetical protein WBI40_09470 [Methylococcaceae bacterium]
MAIIRTKRPTSFTVINNDLINDTRLDWRDLGLLTYLLSKPDNWEVSVAHLQKERKTGRYAIYESLKNLTAAGYVKGRAKQGGFEYEVFDVPTIHLAENHDAENHDAENHRRENPPQVNTEYLTNTDYSINTETTVNTEKAVITPRPENSENSGVKLNAIQYEVYVWACSHEYWHKATTSEEEFLRAYCSPKGGMRKQFEQRNDVKPTRKNEPVNIFKERLNQKREAIDSTATTIQNNKAIT